MKLAWAVLVEPVCVRPESVSVWVLGEVLLVELLIVSRPEVSATVPSVSA